MADEFTEALARSISYLASRDRFEAEIRRHLSDVADDVQDRVVAHLKAKRLLDEKRAAEGVARSKSGRRGVSSAMLGASLESRGAPELEIRRIQETMDDTQEAVALLEGKFSGFKFDRQKAGRFLARRGFEPEVIERAFSRVYGLNE